MKNDIIVGHILDVIGQIPDQYASEIVTSPPYYGLRDYGLDSVLWPEVYYSPIAGLPGIDIPQEAACLGSELTIEAYIGHMVAICRELWRVLRDDGTFWLVIGDSYATSTKGSGGVGSLQPSNVGSFYPAVHFDLGDLKPKDLMMVPHRLALAIQADGWWVRSDIVWEKTNPRPESATDRPSKSHEYIFLLTKSAQYYYDQDAIREPAKASTIDKYAYRVSDNQKYTAGAPGQKAQSLHLPRGRRDANSEVALWVNKRTVWSISVSGTGKTTHFATYPPALIEPCILAGCPPGGIVLDPFMGSGTTGLVAAMLGRNWLGIEANPEYARSALKRIAAADPSAAGKIPHSKNDQLSIFD